jgi:CheY-like chemotaxis protein
MTTVGVDADQDQGITTLGTTFVTKLLDRHEVPHRQRASRLEKALGLSYQQVRRRLANLSGWTIEELHAVAAHFNESLATMFAEDAHPAQRPSALLALGAFKIACVATVGAEPVLHRQGLLVAVAQAQEGATTPQWLIVPADQAQMIESFEVMQIVIEPRRVPKRRIAVLDDDEDLATNIAEYLSLSGYEAKPFFSIESFAKAIALGPFDGYIFDWLVNKQSALGVITQIRSQDTSCPILITTGQVETGQVGDGELSTIAAVHRLQLHEKPVSTLTLKSALEFGFDRLSVA